MPEEKIIRQMRQAAWEKLKAEANIILGTYYPEFDEMDKYKAFDAAFYGFKTLVEDDGLCE